MCAEQRLGAATAWLRALTPRGVLGWTLALALLTEAVNLFMRFGMGLQSSKDTMFLAPFTFGLRIHHGYVGVVLWLLAWAWPRGSAWRRAVLIIGGALALSDAMHHFLFLWPLTGSPEFDFFYAGWGQGG